MPKKTPKMIKIFFIFLLIFSFQSYAFGSVCEELLGERKVVLKNEGGEYVRANTVLVTGELEYNLDFVLKNLGFSHSRALETLKGKTVWSLGEGVSLLTPFLREQGIEAFGLDIWYNSSLKDFPDNPAGERMKSYVQAHGPYLRAGSIENLPIEDSASDVTFSHMVINNFPLDSQKQAIRETIRITKPGGMAVFFGFSYNQVHPLDQFLTKNYSEKIYYAFSPHKFDFVYKGRSKTFKLYRLVINKK